MRRVLRSLLVVAALLGGGFWALWRNWPLRNLPPSRPATTPEEARRRLARLQALEDESYNPRCRTRLLAPDHPTERVIILLHGFTNCPHQFDQLMSHFCALGYSVLNVRLPRHGLADPLTQELAYLSAEELVALTNEVIDLAHGLGNEVTLLGFSLGGTLAAWAAQQRPDLDRAILIAPAIGVRAVSPWRRRPYANLLRWLPNSFRWWDPVKQAERLAPGHAYPRYSTRGVAALLRLGNLVQQSAAQRAPLARQVIVITNPCDDVVDNATVWATVAAWRMQGAPIYTFEFPVEWQLIHDLMDPSQPAQQVGRVYPQLLAWLATFEPGNAPAAAEGVKPLSPGVVAGR